MPASRSLNPVVCLSHTPAEIDSIQEMKRKPLPTENVQREDCQTDRWSHFCVLDTPLRKLAWLLVYKKCPCVQHPIASKICLRRTVPTMPVSRCFLHHLSRVLDLVSWPLLPFWHQASLLLFYLQKHWCWAAIWTWEKKMRLERRASCVQKVNGKR